MHRKGGRRWKESDMSMVGFGMRDAILVAGTDDAVPSSNCKK
jgi:hypothetical protein